MGELIMPGMADAKPRFVHLHLHSEYSLLDGGNRIDRLVERVKSLGMDAVALTDHGNLHGAVAFYQACQKAGVKPILGIEAYVAPDADGKPSDRLSREHTGVMDGGFHLVLLAENQTGWRHLIKLSSDAFLHGFYYKPRMDKKTLAQWSRGLIAINGHLGSSLAFHLTRYVRGGDPNHYRAAVEEAKWHRQVFGPNEAGEPSFFIELQSHDTPEQEQINPLLIQIARELDLPLVADNDAHYLLADDWDAHDTLCCISMGKVKSDTQRLRYSKELYVKSPEQMAALFPQLPEVLENSQRIADRCNVQLDFTQSHAPVVKVIIGAQGAGAGDQGNTPPAVPIGSTAWFQQRCDAVRLEPFDHTKDDASPQELKAQCDAALRELCEAGAVWRYGQAGITPEIRARLDRELRIVADKSISAYFLIVWDFVNEARRRGIPAGARGSGVGTMIGYCLGLSHACPVRFGLLFERFTDPDRSEYPDIDIDLCQDGRAEILDYVRQKYGYVAQIITFGTLKARAAVRDVGRVLDVPLAEVDRLCKLIGDGLKTTLDSALDDEKDLKALYDADARVRHLYDTARRLEGLSRHAGVHAAGVVIATQPLDNIVPLYKQGSDPALPVVTQWDGPTCDKVGLLKMDFLGLRTLSIVERALQLIRSTMTPQQVLERIRGAGRGDPGARNGETGTPVPPVPDPLDLDRITFDDPKVFELFARGETAGVFQFESGGMRNLLMAMKPDRLEDLIAANALFRPGPMDLIPDYVQRKHGRAVVPKVHEIVDRHTAETYGVMVYQEQVMQIVHELGGIPLRQAYSLIKAISKKKEKEIAANREQFINGSAGKGLSEQRARDLFALIEKFAGYGFNKSHSTGYAILAYKTAYLKAYFPLQYMAAVLTYESVSTEKVVQYMDACKHVLKPDGTRGIVVRPPDVNLSDVAFTVVNVGRPDEHLRFGLSAVKGVGEKAIRAVIDERRAGGDYRGLHDFCERVPLGSVNRATIEAMIKCGAFDALHGTEARSAMVAALEDAVRAGSQAAADRDAGQLSFFDSFSQAQPASSPAASLPSTPSWEKRQQLDFEKQVMGLYVSSHPLEDFAQDLAVFTTATPGQVKLLPAGESVIVGGMLSRVKPTLVKNGRSAGQKMAHLTIETQTESVEATVFADTFAACAPMLEKDAIVLLKGKVDRRREEAGLIVDDVIPIEQAPARLTQQVRIALRSSRPAPYNGGLDQLDALLRNAGVRDRRNPGAEVVFEVHDAGRVIYLKAQGLTVGVTRDLPQRVAQVLDESDPSCCRLIGPRKVRAGRATEPVRGQATVVTFTSAQQGDEACASIDRY